jgi:hypothetical protein
LKDARHVLKYERLCYKRDKTQLCFFIMEVTQEDIWQNGYSEVELRID